VEIVGLSDQQFNTTTGLMGFTDDLFVRAGKWNVFDVTVGRFQAWEIANHYGMGLDENTLEREGANIQQGSKHPPAAYGLNYFWDRTDAKLGNVAVHVYPTDFLRGELLGQLGAGALGINPISTNFRASGIFDVGIIKVKAGYELGKAIPQADGAAGGRRRNGFGVALQLVLDPYIEGGAAFARGYDDIWNSLTDKYDDNASNTVTGISGFINGRLYKDLILGVGALNGHWENLAKDERPGAVHEGEVDFDRHFQAFAALQYSFWDAFYIKAVGSYAHWRHQDKASTPFANTSVGGRLRLMVLF
ncbi:MAG TPA: hypothetical protein VGK73_33025, partial [Polyangiaceae bacterium]